MSVMTLLNQLLTIACIFTALFMLVQLFSRQFILLITLGATYRYVIGVMWWFTSSIIILGLILGAAGSMVLTGYLSEWISQFYGVEVRACFSIGDMRNLLLTALIFCTAAFIPAIGLLKRDVSALFSKSA